MEIFSSDFQPYVTHCSTRSTEIVAMEYTITHCPQELDARMLLRVLSLCSCLHLCTSFPAHGLAIFLFNQPRFIIQIRHS